MVIAYDADGTVRCYRDGKPYGKPYKTKPPINYQAGKAQIAFGVRHGVGPSRNRMLTGKILEARLYDRALTEEEVVAASNGILLEVVSEEMIAETLTESQKSQVAAIDKELANLSTELGKIERELEARGAGQMAGDAFFRLAHALLNSKELIYVY